MYVQVPLILELVPGALISNLEDVEHLVEGGA